MQSINLSIDGHQYDVEITKFVGEKMGLKVLDVGSNKEVDNRDILFLIANTLREHHKEYIAYAKRWFRPGNKDREMAEQIERLMNGE